MEDAGTEVVLGLGSNLGDRLAHLRNGVEALAAVLDVRAVSPVCESDPVGYRDQGPFLNVVVLGATTLSPKELLTAAHRVEANEGRIRSFLGAPRTLDVDLVLFGDRTSTGGSPRLPHPRWKERAFVLAPLAEVAPLLRDPETGRTVKELWEACRGRLPPVSWVAAPEVLWRSPS